MQYCLWYQAKIVLIKYGFTEHYVRSIETVLFCNVIIEEYINKKDVLLMSCCKNDNI